MSLPPHFVRLIPAFLAVLFGPIDVTASHWQLSPALAASGPWNDDERIAKDLAALLRAGRNVISANQDLINNPEIGDKGLSGRVVLKAAVQQCKEKFETDLGSIDSRTRHGRLIQAQMESILAVMESAKPSIDKKGTAFKGFIPAVFARLVNEEFTRRAMGEATIKVTAPSELVRNRTSRPDVLESEIILTKFLEPNWPAGEPYAVMRQQAGRSVFRMMVPDYYAASCLSCHGEPKNSLDVTGYPREGAKLGDLGGVISISLFH